MLIKLARQATKTAKRAKRHLLPARLRRSKLGRALRVTVILATTISTGSLAYAIATAKPEISLGVGTSQPQQLGAAATPAPTPAPSRAPGSPDQSGRASWYAYGLLEPDALTCASTTFGRGTYLRVKNTSNGRVVTCLVNDYGPEAWTGRVIDLSRGSFVELDSLSRGVLNVEIFVANGQSGLKVPMQIDLGRAVGYDWCRLSHDSRFCETHRQD